MRVRWMQNTQVFRHLQQRLSKSELAPHPQSEISARITLFGRPSWDRLQLIPKSSPSLRSIFSSDKAPSGNTAGWRKEILRSKKKKKNSGGSRKFNQIGTNGICFSVSPAPSVFLSQREKSQGKVGAKNKSGKSYPAKQVLTAGLQRAS